MTHTRQLAAIMFADIVGYTAMMQQDEAAALTTLSRFKEQLKLRVKNFHGKIVQYYGDGCLMTFFNSSDAVNCAKALQIDFRDLHPVPTRIGIHLGDILFEGGNIFGDSVNIASRIQSMGISGSVLFSESIKTQIKNKADFQFTSLGLIEFKNVDDPFEVFALTNPGFPVPDKSAMAGKFKETKTEKSISDLSVKNKTQQRKTLFLILLTSIIVIGAGYLLYQYFYLPAPLGDKSIAVLPFENMSNDPGQDYFTDGTMDEILTHLFKISDLKVRSRTSVMEYKGTVKNIKKIAQELGVSYILEGSVQKVGDQVRITVQLIDAAKDEHLWAESYDRNLEDLFAIQSEVAQKIANSLQAQISPEVKRRIEAVPTNNAQAYELFLKGREQNGLVYSKFDVSYIHQGIEYFNQAIAMDSTYSNAYAGLGQSYWELAQFSPDYDPEFWEQSKKYLFKAIALDPDNGWAYAQLGQVQYKWDWDKKEALKSLNKAVDLDPGNPELHDELVYYYFRTDDCENLEKESQIISRLQNSESFPARYFFLPLCHKNTDQISRLTPEDFGSLAGCVMMYQGNYEGFIKYTTDSSNYGPDNIFFIGMLGEAYALSGDTLSAIQIIKDLNELSKKRYVSKCIIAPVYLALGKKDKAFELLEQALTERDFLIHVIKMFNVSIYNIQDDPRFKSLMERSWIPR